MKFNFEWLSFWNNLKICFTKPNEYAEKIPLSGGYRNPIIFFLVIFGVSSFIGLIIQSIINKNVSQFFIGISQIVLSLPFALLSLFLLTGIFYGIAKLLGGKGSFEESVRAGSYSTLPFILAAIPYVSYVMDIFYIYILVISFAKAQKYSKMKSSLTIIPVLAVLLVLGVVVGFIGKQQ